MKITVKSHKEWPSFMQRSSLQGYMSVPYSVWVKLFGEPVAKTDGYKTDAEWDVSFYDEDGERIGFATIYNFKDGKNYRGPDGLNVNQIREWHIGGKSKASSIYLLEDYIDQELNVPA